ncbi:unnamed protein product, partial [Allacma fusca]
KLPRGEELGHLLLSDHNHRQLGDFRNGDSGARYLSVSDIVGEESNILGSSTHRQVIGEGDGFDVDRKRPYDAAAAADIVGDSSYPAPKSIIDPVKTVVDASNHMNDKDQSLHIQA